ncbi:TPA: hypothetical protein DIU46_02090 [Patescibacteria group bacterium]|uniref:Uncharacterized protein n=2 Tax=Bacteria division Kazan-3B-28 TaxID=1798534 RepID=A0A0G1ZG35_UNCK3|nr:MAG: hypothetical protein VE99_C0001G0193 [candidate division Kazan bacterium GW2011_GWC1_52_13]KKW26862.1 MAG: hypothetical protein VF00_C0002G0187 [candidate division Kazan bacterium GW2011_GWB1_52_7]HAV65856.1 hypothetical protein [Patescibacteria group bacterium]HCR42733.1 hypothetical protein [Patescibacteria group bacterium]
MDMVKAIIEYCPWGGNPHRRWVLVDAQVQLQGQLPGKWRMNGWSSGQAVFEEDLIELAGALPRFVFTPRRQRQGQAALFDQSEPGTWDFDQAAGTFQLVAPGRPTVEGRPEAPIVLGQDLVQLAGWLPGVIYRLRERADQSDASGRHETMIVLRQDDVVEAMVGG